MLVIGWTHDDLPPTVELNLVWQVGQIFVLADVLPVHSIKLNANAAGDKDISDGTDGKRCFCNTGIFGGRRLESLRYERLMQP